MGEDVGLEDGEWSLRTVRGQLGIDDEEDTTDAIGESLDVSQRDLRASVGPEMVDLPPMTLHGPHHSTCIGTPIDLTCEPKLNMDELNGGAMVEGNGGISHPPVQGSVFRQLLDVGPVFVG